MNVEQEIVFSRSKISETNFKENPRTALKLSPLQTSDSNLKVETTIVSDNLSKYAFEA